MTSPSGGARPACDDNSGEDQIGDAACQHPASSATPFVVPKDAPEQFLR